VFLTPLNKGAVHLTAGNRNFPVYFLYRSFWTALDWLYPPECGGCNRLGDRWCEECNRQTLRLLDTTSCPVCGYPQGQPGVCASCRNDPPPYVALRSAAAYSGPLRKAILRLKYGHDISLGESLSRLLIDSVRVLQWDVDMIIPVPLGLKRMHDRGYNQVDFTGRPCAYALGIPYQPKNLYRIRETRSQVGLSAHERHSNVAGAFEANHERVKEKTVLLIDDVATTGATLKASANALLQAGASRVYALTLARAITLQDHSDLPSEGWDGSKIL
jgi:competence protein ComFC